MADETIIPASAPNPTPETVTPAVTPVPADNSSPAPAPVVETQVQEAPVKESVTDVLGSEEVAPKIETKTEIVPVEVKTETKPEVKTETVKPEQKTETKTEEKPVEEKPTQPEALPSYEWTFPEGTQVDNERISAVNKVFGEMEREGKISHEIIQKYGQQLADFHVTEVNSVAQKIAEAYNKVWSDGAKKMYEEFNADPQIGGEKAEISINAAREFIRRHGGSVEQQKELREFFQRTKTGNFKGLIRLFANANLAMREPKPLTANSPSSQGQGTLKTKMYGNKKQ